jgi:2',3'-cyclic-nucleotide 2'-phosphodiesterase (5'-nucleotidase family)
LRKSIFIVFLIAVAVHAMALSAAGAQRLVLLHVNDLHGYITPRIEKALDPQRPVGGAANLAAMIKAQRSADPGGVILLAAGDMFHGAPVSDLFQGRPVLDLMNALRFDAMTLGNHEFDWGPAALRAMTEDARFPFLSANIADAAGKPLPWIKPYVILERKGIKVAVIGMTTQETAFAVKREYVAGLRFASPERLLPGIISEVRREGATLVVLLSHFGLAEDMRLAAAVHGIDIIVGGHSHTALADPLRSGQTIVVQAGARGLYLGVLELTIDEKTGKLESATENGELKTVWSGPGDAADAETARLVGRYEAKLKPMLDEVVGETRIDLTRRTDGESSLGDVIADSMRAPTGAQIAIQNSGGIRADIPAGRITMERVYMALPFDDDLVCMDLTGEALLDIFEKAAAGRRGLLQVSGLEVAYAVGADGRRKVTGMRVGGAPLDKAKSYRVVTNDFLAEGGDGLTGFRKGSRRVRATDMRDAFVDYLKRHSPISLTEVKRIAVTAETAE